MAKERGYISGSKFVPSPTGRYTRDVSSGKVTDSRGGSSSGASYDKVSSGEKNRIEGTATPEGVVFDSSGQAKTYTSDGKQIVIGSKSDTVEAQTKANLRISQAVAEKQVQSQATPNLLASLYGTRDMSYANVKELPSGYEVVGEKSVYLPSASKVEVKEAIASRVAEQMAFNEQLQRDRKQQESQLKVIDSPIIISEAKRFGKSETISSEGDYVSQQLGFNNDYKPVSENIRDVTGLTALNKAFESKSKVVENYYGSEPSGQKGFSNVAFVFGYPVFEATKTVVQGASHPFQTAKSLGEFGLASGGLLFGRPEKFLGIASETAELVRTNPLKAIGEFGGQVVLFEGVGNVGGRVKVSSEVSARFKSSEIYNDVTGYYNLIRNMPRDAFNKKPSSLAYDPFVKVKDTRSYVKAGESYFNEAKPIIDLTIKAFNQKVSVVKDFVVESLKPITEPVKQVSKPFISELKEAQLNVYSDFINPLENKAVEIKDLVGSKVESFNEKSPIIFETDAMRKTKAFEQQIKSNEEAYRNVIMSSDLSLVNKRKALGYDLSEAEILKRVSKYDESLPKVYIKENLVKVKSITQENRLGISEGDLTISDKKSLNTFDLTKSYSVSFKEPKVKSIYLTGEGFKGFKERGVTVSEPTSFQAEIINKELKFTSRTPMELKPELSEDFLSLEKYNLNEGKTISYNLRLPKKVIDIIKINNDKNLIQFYNSPSEFTNIKVTRKLPGKIVEPSQVVKKTSKFYEGVEDINLNQIAELKPTKRPEFKKEDLSDEFLTRTDKSNVVSEQVAKLDNPNTLFSATQLKFKEVKPVESVSESVLVSIPVSESKKSYIQSTDRLVSFKPTRYIEVQEYKPLFDLSQVRKNVQTPIIKVEQLRTPVYSIDEIQKSNNKFDLGSVQKQEQTPLLDVAKIQDVSQEFKPKQEQEQIYDFKTINERVIRPRPEEPIIKIIKPIKPFRFRESSIIKKSNLYDVEVGRKGKTKRYELKKGLSFEEARNYLTKALKNTASASGRVLFQNQQVNLGDLGKEFYTSKTGRLVQKREYRISSMGEKAQITYKGLAKLRSDRVNKVGGWKI